MKTRFLFLVIIILTASLSFSQPAFAGGSETGKVVNIIVESNNIISVWLDGEDYMTDCTGGARWTIPVTDPLFKEKYTAVLSAAQTGKRVILYHVTERGCGQWDSNQVFHVTTSFQ